MISTMIKMVNAPIEPPITGTRSKMERLQIVCPIKKKKICNTEKLEYTGLKNSLSAIEKYAHCLDFTSRVGFPKLY